MTRRPEDFEERLHRVLEQAASRLEVPAAAWPGPASEAPVRTGTPRPGSILALAGVIVTLAITVGLLALLGHRQPTPTGGAPGNPLPPPPPASVDPHPSQQEWHYINGAWKAVVARDPACNGSHGSELSYGSPGRALTARFAVLRLPAVPARALQGFLRNRQAYGPLATLGGFNQELYLNQIHLARTAFGARFYVLPAGNVTGQRGVPVRCGPEQVAALTHQIAHLPRPERRRLLTAQRKWLAYLRYQALHPEGVCATFIPPHAPGLDLADNLGCARLADFERWGVLADGSAYLGGSVGVFWTVVPDGVATVTVRFPGRPASSARPVNNVVVVRQPWKAPTQSGFPSTITLRGPDGRVIRDVNVTPNMITLCGYGC